MIFDRIDLDPGAPRFARGPRLVRGYRHWLAFRYLDLEISLDHLHRIYSIVCLPVSASLEFCMFAIYISMSCLSLGRLYIPNDIS